MLHLTFPRARGFTSLLLGGALAVGSASAVSADRFAQPATPVSDEASEPTDLPKSAVAEDYVIGPGDTLSIFVWRNPELTTQVPVRPDGKISSPLIEDMVAVGKTTSVLARDIESKLATYIRSPKVNVIVVTALSAGSQVRVVGQAASPKAIPFREGLTVLDVVIAVGGLGEFAAGNRAKIMRPTAGGKSLEIKVKLKNLIERGDMSQNVEMKPGDVLVIPESFL
jgi:polysaccharide export outer membrane protein